MHIKAVELYKIQGYKNKTVIPFARKTVFKGENDSGKSTIRKSLEVFSKKHSSMTDNPSLITTGELTGYIKIYLNSGYILKAELLKTKTIYHLLDCKLNFIKAWDKFNDEITDILEWVGNEEILINSLSNKQLFIDTSSRTNGEFIMELTKLPAIEEKIYNINECKNEVNSKISALQIELNYKEGTLRFNQPPIQQLEYAIHKLENLVNKRNQINILIDYLKTYLESKVIYNKISNEYINTKIILNKTYNKLNLLYKYKDLILFKNYIDTILDLNLTNTKVFLYNNYKNLILLKEFIDIKLNLQNLSKTLDLLKSYYSISVECKTKIYNNCLLQLNDIKYLIEYTQVSEEFNELNSELLLKKKLYNTLLLQEYLITYQVLNSIYDILYIYYCLRLEVLYKIKDNIKNVCPKCGNMF